MLTLRALSVGYASRSPVLTGLNARMKEGEFVALIGRNGSGKTTLLLTLAGILPPLAGDLLYGHSHIRSFSKREWACRVAIVLTHLPDTGFLTVREAVTLGRLPYSRFATRLSAYDRDVVHFAMSQTGITAFADRRLSHLSDGERQRVLVAKALAQQTPVILLDEPLAFLDPESRAQLLSLLRTIAHKQNKTVIMSSHDIELTLRYADRAWQLNVFDKP